MWQPIETAPRDGTHVLVWHIHDSDPYYKPSRYLTIYGAHCEGLTIEYTTGAYVATYGGELDDAGDGYIPAWWFKAEMDWEHPLAPTHWMPLPPPPTEDTTHDPR